MAEDGSMDTRYPTAMESNSPSPRRLVRATRDRWIGGVAGGLARYFDLDPTLIRVLFLIAFFGFGTGFLVYLVLWLLMPATDRF
jgi:phage shock protein PspC (stress-responsive transcriptional regulator)